MANEKTVKVEDEDFLDEKKLKKEKKGKKEKSGLFSKIMNIVLWILLFAWIAIVCIDFYNVHQEKDAMFCLSTEETEYEDGKVKSCTGLLYKVYKYDRTCFKAIEFGPIWSSDRSLNEEACKG